MVIWPIASIVEQYMFMVSWGLSQVHSTCKHVYVYMQYINTDRAPY